MSPHGEGSQRSEALLAATSGGTVSLLLGSGTGRLAEAIPRLGGRVIAAEWELPEHETGPTHGVLRTQVSGRTPLPFADASFDSVFASDIFATAVADAAGPDRSRHVQLLRECNRVLKPGGRLVGSLPNATGLNAVLRPLQWISAHLPFLPFRLRDRARKLAASAPRARGYAKGKASCLLYETDFEAVTYYLPWPRRDHWKMLVPDARARSERLTRGIHWDGATDVLLDVVTQLGLQEHLILEYCFVAQKKAGDRAVAAVRRPLLDDIVRRVGAEIDNSDPLTLFDRSERLTTFICSDHFFKLAWRPIEAQRFAAEVEAIDRAGSTAARRYMIPYSHHGTIHSVPFIAFPAAEVIHYRGESEKIAVLEEAFNLLGLGSVSTELQNTVAWSRIFSDESQNELRRLGAGDILDHLKTATASCRVPAGLVHGDLHAGNILRKDGRTLLIDWDRFEAGSPILLDRCNAVAQLLVARATAGEKSEPRVAAMLQLANREAEAPLLDRVNEAAGELSWREMVAFYILSLASWAATQNITTLASASEERVRRDLVVCRSCLER